MLTMGFRVVCSGPVVSHWLALAAVLLALCRAQQLPPLHVEVPLHELANPNALVKHHDGPGPGSNAAFSIIEAPHGFFVDGSSIAGLNGVYGPRLKRPEDLPDTVRPLIAHLHHVLALGVYRHDSTGWMLANLNSDRQNPPNGGSDAPSDGNEWVFIDPNGVERFGHRGHAQPHARAPRALHPTCVACRVFVGTSWSPGSAIAGSICTAQPTARP
jgi:hypothetical protein